MMSGKIKKKRGWGAKGSRLDPKLSLETHWGFLLLFNEGYRKHFIFFFGAEKDLQAREA